MPSTTPVVRLPAPPRPKPSEYGKLVERVWRALKAAGIAKTGCQWLVFGGGDPSLPLMGYCPVCERGVVAVWLIDGDPPRIRMHEGCTDGCPPEIVVEAFR